MHLFILLLLQNPPAEGPAGQISIVCVVVYVCLEPQCLTLTLSPPQVRDQYPLQLMTFTNRTVAVCFTPMHSLAMQFLQTLIGWPA